MSTIIKIAIGRTLDARLGMDWNNPNRIKNEKQWIRESIAKKILESYDELIEFYINEQEKTIEGKLFVQITEEQKAKLKANNPNFY